LGGAAAFGGRALDAVTEPYRVNRDNGLTTVSVNLAGFRKEDIDVSIDEKDNFLTVKAETKQEPDHSDPNVEEGTEDTADTAESENPKSKSATHGFYDRKVDLSFELPDDVDFDSVKSTYTDGVLAITFGKRTPEVVEPRKISVN
jgi:HSP20 family molecular chaperone IbpA